MIFGKDRLRLHRRYAVRLDRASWRLSFRDRLDRASWKLSFRDRCLNRASWKLSFRDGLDRANWKLSFRDRLDRASWKLSVRDRLDRANCKLSFRDRLDRANWKLSFRRCCASSKLQWKEKQRCHDRYGHDSMSPTVTHGHAAPCRDCDPVAIYFQLCSRDELSLRCTHSRVIVINYEPTTHQAKRPTNSLSLSY